MKKEWSYWPKVMCYVILMLSGAWFGTVLTAVWYIGSTFTVGNWIYTVAVSAAILAITVKVFKALNRARLMEMAVNENNRRVAD